MGYISLDDKQNGENLRLFYQDYGQGQPVILIHGWPLSHKAWEPQMQDIADAGFRAIAYDRRGFGESSKPYDAYDYSTLARDLRTLILKLDLKDCIIVGFSMGGGEVVRYFTDYGNDRIAKAVLISSIIPLVAKKDDNPDGVPEEAVNEIMEALHTDRVGFMEDFASNFFNAEKTGVSKQQLHYAWSIASHASPRATIECAKSWGGTDFRPECQNVTVPTLIIHGDTDGIVPIETAGDQAAELIPDNTYHKVSGGPHGLNLTHREELNKTLIDFLKK
ncbi:alpha/beta fold hydrolase [Roseivirga sp. BDSF3-8]|uniref:alpha/beta fold hydrolase n=1 Tax=Roseivirga sp. BDSF3-8 TaxID=3241598 RepID=UPI0035322500